MAEPHVDVLQGWSDPRRNLTPYQPLSVSDFKSMTQVDKLRDMGDELLSRLWIIPIQRLLQWRYQINHLNYTATTTPTITELKDDFEVATVLVIDKFALNEEDVTGLETVDGAGRSWDHLIPVRAHALLERYKKLGGRIGRA